MMKKMMLVVMAFTLFFAFVAPHSADARRGGGGFKSGTKSYTTTPKKSTKDSNVSNSTNKSNTGQTAKRGFFSGGGLMKGLMIGGIAGMLFGGMFSNMGAMGNIFGFLINMLVIYAVVMVGIALFRRFKKPRYDDNRGRRY